MLLQHLRSCRAATLLALLPLLGVLGSFKPALADPRSGYAQLVVRVDYRVPQSEVQSDAEITLLQLLNEARQERGLPLLAMDSSLRLLARAHSQDMATQGYVGHGSMSGESFVDRLARAVRKGLVGENVTIANTVEAAHNAFIVSPGHLQNMLEPRFHRVGIGVSSAGQLGMAITEDFSE